MAAIVMAFLLFAGGATLLDSSDRPDAAEGYDPPESPAETFPRETTPRLTPATAPLRGVASVVAGYGSSCAVLLDGGVVCWGENDDGQLGSTPSDPVPWALPVPSIDGATATPAAAWGHACAVAHERVLCWGANYDGRIGDGTTSPTRVPGDIGVENVERVAAGGTHTCAATTDGLWCWGSPTTGQEGKAPAPKRVLDRPVSDISISEEHSCALLRDDGSMWCWGTNDYGELGDGTKTDATEPRRATAVDGLEVTKVSVGVHHTCALISDHTITCWGRGRQGQLGNESEEMSGRPETVHGMADAIDVAAGGDFTCALREEGTVSCWGTGFTGQTGSGHDRDLQPFEVPGLSDVTSISAGSTHSCALLEDTTVRCWGGNLYGQLGGRRGSGAVVTVLG